MRTTQATSFNLQYIIDGIGNTSAVLIPYKDWLLIKKQLKLKDEEYPEPSKEAILHGIKEAMNEVTLHIKGKKKLQTAKEFLNEL